MFGPALLHLKRPQEFEWKAHGLLTKICISWIWSTTKILSTILKLKYFCIINLYVTIFSILYFYLQCINPVVPWWLDGIKEFIQTKERSRYVPYRQVHLFSLFLPLSLDSVSILWTWSKNWLQVHIQHIENLQTTK